MKRYTDLGDEERDLLLFEYLEGQLSEQQTKELEARLAADPALAMELAHWKEAFLTPGFPNTEPLEKRLLKPIPFVYSSMTALMLALFTFLVCLLPLPTPKQTRLRPIASKPAIPAPIESKKERVVPERKSAAEKEPLSSALTPQPIRAARAKAPFPSSSLKAVDDELLEPIPLALEVTPEAGNLALPPVRIVPIPVPTPKKVLTRKQKRQIAEMKEKALQRRKANEFLKGNEPYVVPLNTEKF